MKGLLSIWPTPSSVYWRINAQTIWRVDFVGVKIDKSKIHFRTKTVGRFSVSCLRNFVYLTNFDRNKLITCSDCVFANIKKMFADISTGWSHTGVERPQEGVGLRYWMTWGRCVMVSARCRLAWEYSEYFILKKYLVGTTLTIKLIRHFSI